MRKLRFYMVMCIVVLFIGSVAAQTQSEIDAAKAMARQMGYSDREIADMQKGVRGDDNNNSASGQNIGRVNRVNNGNIIYGQQYGQYPQYPPFNNLSAPVMLGDSLYYFENYNEEISEDSTAIFGHSMFKSKYFNFEPSYDIPTPTNYILASGDEVILDMWGGVYQNLVQTISPEGSITIQDIGPVYLVGKTVEQAEDYLKDILSRIYSGLEGNDANTFLRLTLGKIRSVSVNVVGNVEYPGSYSLPSLSTVASVICMAGGPVKIGTIREIKLYRDNVLKAQFDAYDFIFKGDCSSNIRLEDNDLVVVGTYRSVVNISGEVKREMNYEMLDGQTIEDLLYYAGGFKAAANTKQLRVERRLGDRAVSYSVESSDFNDFILKNSDVVVVSENIKRFSNSVEIKGGVWLPGNYSISANVRTVKDLIEVAGGLRDDAYMERGYVERYDNNRFKSATNFNVEKVVNGEEELELRPDDIVRLFVTEDLKEESFVYSRGELNTPSAIEYRVGMTLGDVILLSGGFNIGASRSNIEIARRNHNNVAMMASDTVANIYTFNLIEEPESNNFILLPYDEIYVRTAPNYKKQQTIEIRGEVNFPGTYVVERNTVRVSDIVAKAGGFNNDAYVRGASIERILSDDEYKKMELAVEMASREFQGDSTFLELVNKGDRYKIGFDMESAIDNPGSFADVVLEIGDVITIPKMNNTVRISGGVTFENTVVYDPKMSLKDYVNQAGGYAKRIHKSRTYIVFMNGSIARKGDKNFKIEPGCQIVVPVRDPNRERKISPTEVMSIATSSASIASMVISMMSIIKRQ